MLNKLINSATKLLFWYRSSQKEKQTCVPNLKIYKAENILKMDKDKPLIFQLRKLSPRKLK